MSQIFCFRHAQASYLAKNYDQLSPKGERQSAHLGKYLVEQSIQFDRVYVGPLVRQQKTLEIVAKAYADVGQSLVPPIVLPALKEHHGPRTMRLAYDQLVKNDAKMKGWDEKIKAEPEQIRKYSLLMFQQFMNQWVQGKIVVDGVESWAVFRKSVSDAMQAILAATDKGETIAVFTSGGTIASIVGEALGLTDDTKMAAMNFSIRNTSITRFLFSQDQFNLHSFNELAHLPKEMETFV